MANQPAAKVTATSAAPTLTLNEFCSRLSETVKRTELIGAFAFVETRAGSVIDTEDAFRARFDAFVNTPV